MKKQISIFIILSLLIVGCATKKVVQKEYYQESNLYNYFLNEQNLTENREKINKNLPIVLSFVPSREKFYNRVISERDKRELLKKIKKILKKRGFKKVIIIPTPFLRDRGGLNNLNDIQKIYQNRYILLLSYFKTTFPYRDRATYKRYKTLLKNYKIIGRRGDINCMIEAVAIDINKKNLLLNTTTFKSLRTKNIERGEIKDFHFISKKLIKKIDKWSNSL